MTSFWQRVYDSPWHVPGLVVAMSLAALGYAWAKRRDDETRLARFFTSWLALFGAAIVADALLTAPGSPLLPGDANVVQWLSIAFILLGDVRAYVLVERATRRDEDASPAIVTGALWGALVSVLMAAPARLVPAMQQNPRWIYLTYELIALAQALVWRFAVLPRRTKVGVERARWGRDVMAFVAVQYGLWALADVVILSGVGAGYGLRVVPNVLYYGAFVGYVFVRAPRSLRS